MEKYLDIIIGLLVMIVVLVAMIAYKLGEIHDTIIHK